MNIKLSLITGIVIAVLVVYLVFFKERRENAAITDFDPFFGKRQGTVEPEYAIIPPMIAFQ